MLYNHAHFKFMFKITLVGICVESLLRASPGAAVKLCLGDLLVMRSNPETVSLHMQG